MKWENIYEFSFSHPVVMVIDMQNDFCHQGGVYYRNNPQTFNVSGIKKMIPTLVHFIGQLRRKKIPVVFCKYLLDDQARDAGIYLRARPFLRKEGLRKNTWGGDIIDELEPLKNDFIVEKSRYSAFYNTNLEVVLRSLKAETLFFTGIATNLCVESSLRDAFFRDYQCVLVEDCCKAWNEEYHLAAVRNVIHGLFGMVVASSDLLASIAQEL